MVREIYQNNVMEIPFIKKMSERLQYQLCIALKPLPARKGDEICTQGDHGSEMYIIDKGICHCYRRAKDADKRIENRKRAIESINLNPEEVDGEAFKNQDKYGEKIQDLYAGSFFGEEVILDDELKRTFTTIAMAESQLLYLSKDAILALPESDKEKFLEQLKDWARKRAKEIKGRTRKAQRLDRHISRLTETDLTRTHSRIDGYDRDALPEEVAKFEGALTDLLPEVREAIKARLTVRQLRHGQATVGSRDSRDHDALSQGMYFVLEGHFDVVPHVEGDGDRVRRVDRYEHREMVPGGIFSGDEAVKKLDKPGNHGVHVENAIVSTKEGATALWLDGETFSWMMQDESQRDVMSSLELSMEGSSSDEDDESGSSRRLKRRHKSSGSLSGHFESHGAGARRSASMRALTTGDEERAPQRPRGVTFKGASEPEPEPEPEPRGYGRFSPRRPQPEPEPEPEPEFAAGSSGLRHTMSEPVGGAAAVHARLDKQDMELKGMGARLSKIEGMVDEVRDLVRALNAGTPLRAPPQLAPSPRPASSRAQTPPRGGRPATTAKSAEAKASAERTAEEARPILAGDADDANSVDLSGSDSD
eukprot:COSAG04_NODE_1136_length_8119_cov_81.520574_4_plen_592_part_00